MRTYAHIELPDLELLGRETSSLADRELQRVRELREHLQSCASCLATAEIDDLLRRNQASLGTLSACPSLESWMRVASGLMNQSQAATLLSHASSCNACSAELRIAREDLNGPEIEEAVLHLRSSSAAWQRDLAQSIAAEEQRSDGIRLSHPRKILNFPRHRLWMGAVAAMLLFAVGTIAWRLNRAGSDRELLAQAYDRQRRTDLHLPDGDSVPLASMNRGSADRAAPTELLRLRLRAQEHLDKNANDAYWHSVLGRIALVENSGEIAKREIDTAFALDPGLDGLKSDLAAAYFEIGDAGGDPLAFARAADLYGQVIDDPATKANSQARAMAHFNRALCWERQSIYYAAVTDYEQALAAERDPKWRLEIQRRLDAARSVLRKSEVLPHADQDKSPERFLNRKSAASPQSEEEYELYLDAAIRDWLPMRNASPAAEAALRGLALLGRSHHDLWINDIEASRPDRVAQQGLEYLARAVKSNAQGSADQALGEASKSARMFRQAGVNPGGLRAEVEVIYTLQRQGKECLEKARPLLQSETLTRYAWLRAHLLLEAAACRGATGDAQGFTRDASAALEIARSASLPLQILRAEGFLVAGSDALGDTTTAWRLAQQGLRDCESYAGARMPAYQFLQSMYSAALTQDLRYAGADIAEASTHAASLVPNMQIQAYAQEVLGQAQTAIGQNAEAAQSFEKASALLNSLPPGLAVSLYRANWEADRSEWLARSGQLPQALERMRRADASVLAAENYTVRQAHYTESARLLILAGDPVAALRQLAPATRGAERALSTTSGETQRLAWERSNGRGYRLLVKAVADEGDSEKSFRAWEWYRAAPYRKALALRPASNTGNLPDTPSTTLPSRLSFLTLVVARVEEEYFVWSIDPNLNQQIRMVRLKRSPEAIEATANTLLELCARRESPEPSIRAIGAQLYSTLFADFQEQMNHAGSLQFDIDPRLQGVPFAALVQADGRYLGLAHSMVFLPAWWSVRPPAGERLQAAPHALLVEGRQAGALARDGSVPMIPAQYLETRYLQDRFPGATLLRSSEASTTAIGHLLSQADVFHFSGHTVAGAGGRALLLGESGQLLDAATLSRLPVKHLRLAVLATCSSSGGKDAGINDVGSLAHALLAAGADNVIATLWDVDTQSSRELMVRLYETLRGPASIPEALRSAQQQLQAVPDTAHPFYWASAAVYPQ